MAIEEDEPTYFPSPAAFRRWLERHHAKAAFLWVGFHKKATGKPSMTWPESVDQALCFGWIDGVRRAIDDTRYTIRFTPRRAGSAWSAINIARVRALAKRGLMTPAGLAAFRRRTAARSRIYSYEQRRGLSPAFERRLRAHVRAWTFFRAQPDGYRRTAGFWVMSAKREETRERRFAALVRDSAAGRRIALLRRTPARTRPQ